MSIEKINDFIGKILEQTRDINLLLEINEEKIKKHTAKEDMVKEVMKTTECSEDTARNALYDNNYDVDDAIEVIFRKKWLL